MKLKEKIKEKSIKLSARIFGIMTACLSSALQPLPMLKQTQPQVYGFGRHLDHQKQKWAFHCSQSTAWTVSCRRCYMLGASGKNGISSVKGWLIAIGVAAALLVFGDAFLDSIYVA